MHTNDIPKGIKEILNERGLWRNDLVLDCKNGPRKVILSLRELK